MSGLWDVDRCEDCGIPLDRHGEDCGYYAGDPYGNPEYGRPAGWLNAGTGEFTPIGEGDYAIAEHSDPDAPESRPRDPDQDGDH